MKFEFAPMFVAGQTPSLRGRFLLLRQQNRLENL